jgi:hypothetical protein
MTEAVCKKAHFDLWDWLSKNAKAKKEDWPGWNKPEYEEFYHEPFCFACELAAERAYDAGADIEDEDFIPCSHCPLDPEIMKVCHHWVSPHSKWLRAETARTRKKYARIIRDAWREIP